MPDTPAPGARKALKFVGNVSKNEYVPGVPAQDLTQEQAAIWLPDDLYQTALDSGYYEAMTQKEAKAAHADAAKDEH